MCNFFSVTSDGNGNIQYFDWELRKKCLTGELDYDPDSHTSINDYFGHKGAAEDKRNKYEYNPLTGKFTVDQINTGNDSAQVVQSVRALDFAKIVPQLIIKPIVHPFKDITFDNENIDRAIALLEEWKSVRASVRASVWAYTSSFFDLTAKQWKVPFKFKGTNPFQSAIDLWEMGVVPSYDGKTWRLHAGPKAGVVWEG